MVELTHLGVALPRRRDGRGRPAPRCRLRQRALGQPRRDPHRRLPLLEVLRAHRGSGRRTRSGSRRRPSPGWSRGRSSRRSSPAPGEDPLEHYLEVVAGKTGSLIATSARYGARFGGASTEVEEALTAYGEIVGSAFQLSDDILDIASESDESGKTPGTDLREGVPTLPVLMARASGRPGRRPPARAARRSDLTDDALHAEALGLLRATPGPGRGPCLRRRARRRGQGAPERPARRARSARPSKTFADDRSPYPLQPDARARSTAFGIATASATAQAAAERSVRGGRSASTVKIDQRDPDQHEADPAAGGHVLVEPQHAEGELQDRGEVLQQPQGHHRDPDRRRAEADQRDGGDDPGGRDQERACPMPSVAKRGAVRWTPATRGSASANGPRRVVSTARLSTAPTLGLSSSPGRRCRRRRPGRARSTAVARSRRRARRRPRRRRRAPPTAAGRSRSPRMKTPISTVTSGLMK